jgi:hypothetical protein
MTEPLKAGEARRGLLWMALFWFGLAILVLVLAAEWSLFHPGGHVLGTGFEIVAVCLGVWLAIILIWWYRRRGRFDPFELPVWFSLNAYLQVVFNVLVFQRDVSLGSPLLAGSAGAWAAQAVLLMGVGLTALWGGYVWFTPRRELRPRPAQPQARRPRLKAVIAVWLLSWTSQTLAIVSGVSSYLGTGGFVWTAYLEFIVLVGDLAAFILLLYHFRNPTMIGWVWLAFACVSGVISGLVVGTRGAVFILLYVIMAAYYARLRLKKSWLLLGFLALFVIVPTVNTFRSNLFGAGFDRSAGAGFLDRVPILFESARQTLSQPISGLAEETRTTFEQRQGGLLEITAAIMAAHPRLEPYVGLDMISYFATQLVPRVFWPAKPVGHSELYLIATAYLGAPNDLSFASPGQFADAYRAGGWLFVVLWCGLLGISGAWLYRRGPRQGSLAGTAFYLLMLTSFLTYDGHIMRTVLELLKFGLPIWILTVYVLFEPEGRSQPAADGRNRGEMVHDSD